MGRVLVHVIRVLGRGGEVRLFDRLARRDVGAKVLDFVGAGQVTVESGGIRLVLGEADCPLR